MVFDFRYLNNGADFEIFKLEGGELDVYRRSVGPKRVAAMELLEESLYCAGCKTQIDERKTVLRVIDGTVDMPKLARTIQAQLVEAGYAVLNHFPVLTGGVSNA
jgi:hypothetical protein